MKILLSLIVLVFLVTNLAVAGDTIKVAAIFSLTGEAAAVSDEHLIAVRFAVDEINHKGGVLGKEIELIVIDNMSSGIGSRQAAKEAVSRGVVAVLGGSWSSHALGMAPVLQSAGIPMLTPTATNPKITAIGNYIFRACFVDTFQGKVAAKFTYNDLNKRRAIILTNVDQVFSIELTKEFSKSFSALGGVIVAKLDYVEDIFDYEEIVVKLGKYDYDLIFLPGYARDSAQIIKKTRENGINTTFMSGDGWSHLMLKYAPNSLSNSYYLTHWDKGLTDKSSVEFTAKISNVVDEREINGGTALSYDMVYLLADAIERAGKDERSLIRTSLAATKDFVGVSGAFTFDAQGNPIKPAVILKFAGSEVEFLKQVFP